MSRDVAELIETIKTTLGNRLGRSSMGYAALIEDLAPVNDKYADYHVAYKAVITPQRLDQARLELWVTDAAHLAVGIEKRVRIAERLGVRTGSSFPFIAGHEPRVVPVVVLEKLVEAVGSGALIIRARQAFGRLLSATAKISASEDDPDGFRAYTKSLRIGVDIPFGAGVDLPYRPW